MALDTGGAAKTLIVLTTSLLISSVLISWFLLQAYGVNAAGITLPERTDINLVYNSVQNFSTDSVDYAVIDVNGKWTYTAGEGRTLTETGNKIWSALAIDHINPDSTGSYDNTYYIKNSKNLYGQYGDYSIFLRFTGGVDQNELIFNKDGIYIPYYLIDSGSIIGSKYSYAYPNIKDIPEAKIRTLYKPSTDGSPETVTVWFNDVELFTTTNLNANQNLFGIWGRHWGGVGSYTVGFNFERFITTGVIKDTGGSTGQDFLGMIVKTLSVLLDVTTYRISPQYIPLEWQIILIGSQEFGILVCIAVIIRG